MPGAVHVPTTSWTLVLKAASDKGGIALDELCVLYWPPIFAFIRAHTRDAEEARDLTQEFFTRLIEKRYLQSVDPERGRFRSFLYAAVRHFLSNERDRVRAEKRGGGRPVLSLTIEDTNDWLKYEPPDSMTPDKVFERRWALLVIERALARLRADQEKAGHLQHYEVLKGCLTSDGDAMSGREAAAALGMNEAAVRMAVHRLREKFGEALRAEVALTVGSRVEVDEEVRHLLSILSN